MQNCFSVSSNQIGENFPSRHELYQTENLKSVTFFFLNHMDAPSYSGRVKYNSRDKNLSKFAAKYLRPQER
jgi:hypothetical protein